MSKKLANWVSINKSDTEGKKVFDEVFSSWTRDGLVYVESSLVIETSISNKISARIQLEPHALIESYRESVYYSDGMLEEIDLEVTILPNNKRQEKRTFIERKPYGYCQATVFLFKLNKLSIPKQIELINKWANHLSENIGKFPEKLQAKIAKTLDLKKCRIADFVPLSDQKKFDELVKIIKKLNDKIQRLITKPEEEKSKLNDENQISFTKLELFVEKKLKINCDDYIYDYLKSSGRPEEAAYLIAKQLKEYRKLLAKNEYKLERLICTFSPLVKYIIRKEIYDKVISISQIKAKYFKINDRLIKARE